MMIKSRFLLICLVLIFSTCTKNYVQKFNTEIPYEEVPLPDEMFNEMFKKPDIFAQYPGGKQGLSFHIQRNSRYPYEAYKQGIQGRLLVTFVVGTDGRTKDIQIQMSPADIISEVYIDLINKMDRWKPAILDGKPIEQRYAINVRVGGNFIFQSDSTGS